MSTFRCDLSSLKNLKIAAKSRSFLESFMIHQRACWIEDIKLHIDNFCIVWYISIFLLTVAVYYAYMAGLEV